MNTAQTAPIVVVGAGQAGATLAIQLRSAGCREHIVLLGDEAHAPYERPQLSKELLAGTMVADDMRVQAVEKYLEQGIELRTGSAVTRLDLEGCRVQLQDGTHRAWSRLVLATGSTPHVLPGLTPDVKAVFTFRTLDDALALRARAGAGHRMAIVGGGLIGMELASSLSARGVAVSVIDPAERPMAHVLIRELGELSQKMLAEQGVRFHWRSTVASVNRNGAAIHLHLSDGAQVNAETVVVCIGTVPNLSLAREAGLECSSHGILVDDQGATSHPNVYAVGDCAAFFHPRYGRHLRLEQWQHAGHHARALAALLAGGTYAYDAPPWAWTEVAGRKLVLLGLKADAERIVWAGSPSRAGSVAILCRGARAVGAQGFISSRTASRLKAALAKFATPEQLAALCDAEPVPA